MAQDKDLKTPNVPPLRFPGFTDDWKQTTLNEVADFIKERVNTSCLQDNYVSTENLIGNFGGVQMTMSIPLDTNVIRFKKGDVLVSNIRPYLRKVWFADKEGGCSADVFVFRAKGIEPSFLYNTIANDSFINYVMSGAKGVKMPRGDKQQMLKYPFFVPSIEEQRKISSLLSLLNERIATQNKIIEDLKKLKSAISVQLFEGHNIIGNSNEWKIVSLGDITENFHHRNKNLVSYPMYSVTNTSGFSPQHEVFEGKEIKDEDISIYKIIHKGEFAYNPARINVGSIGRYDEEEPCMISSLYVCFRPTAEVDSDWLLYYLQSAKKIYQYGIFGEGGVRIYLFYPNFSRIEALLPPLKVQKEIASILKFFNRKIKLDELLLSKYQEQKKYLLSNMFI